MLSRPYRIWHHPVQLSIQLAVCGHSDSLRLILSSLSLMLRVRISIVARFSMLSVCSPDPETDLDLDPDPLTLTLSALVFRCTACGHASVTFDPFWDLSLPIPSKTGQVRLQACFDLFTKEEVLDGDEKPVRRGGGGGGGDWTWGKMCEDLRLRAGGGFGSCKPFGVPATLPCSNEPGVPCNPESLSAPGLISDCSPDKIWEMSKERTFRGILRNTHENCHIKHVQSHKTSRMNMLDSLLNLLC